MIFNDFYKCILPQTQLPNLYLEPYFLGEIAQKVQDEKTRKEKRELRTEFISFKNNLPKLIDESLQRTKSNLKKEVWTSVN